MNKLWPALYGKSSTGKIKIWKIRVVKKTKTAEIVTEHGYMDSEELQEARVRITEGKNVGCSNETSPYQQACLEAEAKWKKKQDKKYTTEKSGKSDLLLPMLALDYKKRGKSIEWPAFAQPKLNGIRCLARKVSRYAMEYTSRGGKFFTTLDHLTPHLLKLLKKGEVLDGELFTKELTFQQIVSAVKRQQDETQAIEFWVYDVVRDEPFADRAKFLDHLGLSGPLVLVPTLPVKNEAQMKKFQQQMVAAGYEGTIIRNMLGVYKTDHRSADLQKYKDFIDEEFEIVGGKQGVGKDEGAVTFLCETEEGKRFDARPRGTYAQRQAWWADIMNLTGKQLTVRYQARSDDNIPIFPVGIAIRDYE